MLTRVLTTNPEPNMKLAHAPRCNANSGGECNCDNDPQAVIPMPRRLVAAHTRNSGYVYYPPYINVTHGKNNDVTVTLRGEEKEGGACGSEAVATFSRAEFALFLLEAAKHISD